MPERKSGNRSQVSIVVVAFLLITTALANVHADQFTTTDGRKITGTVLSEEAGIVELWTVKGTITLRRDQIEKQRKTKTNYDRYLAKHEKAKSTVKSQLALAKWCTKKKLTPQAQLHFEEVLELDPDHTVAHQSLGHRKVGGVWRAGKSAPKSVKSEDPLADRGEDSEIPPFVLLKFAEADDLDANSQRRISTELRRLMKGAARPMRFVTQSSGMHDYQLEISLVVEKGKRSTYYGKGIQQQWIGRVDALLTWVGEGDEGEKSERRIAICIQDLENIFSGGADLAESEAKQHTARESIDALFAALREHRFLKSRGLQKSKNGDARSIAR